MESTFDGKAYPPQLQSSTSTASLSTSTSTISSLRLTKVRGEMVRSEMVRSEVRGQIGAFEVARSNAKWYASGWCQRSGLAGSVPTAKSQNHGMNVRTGNGLKTSGCDSRLGKC